MKRKLRHDNVNYITEETLIYDDKVIVNYYRKVLGGTQWFYLNTKCPKNNHNCWMSECTKRKCSKNYNNCWMPYCREVFTREDYDRKRKKYCKKIKATKAFTDAVQNQHSIPKWAQGKLNYIGLSKKLPPSNHRLRYKLIPT